MAREIEKFTNTDLSIEKAIAKSRREIAENEKNET